MNSLTHQHELTDDQWESLRAVIETILNEKESCAVAVIEELSGEHEVAAAKGLGGASKHAVTTLLEHRFKTYCEGIQNLIQSEFDAHWKSVMALIERQS